MKLADENIYEFSSFPGHLASSVRVRLEFITFKAKASKGRIMKGGKIMKKRKAGIFI